MRLFVGLGNPGAKYQGNRHNIGFMALDEIARRHGFGPWRRRFQGETSEGNLGNGRVILLKPTTYMNESGNAVGEAVNFFKMGVGDITGEIGALDGNERTADAVALEPCEVFAVHARDLLPTLTAHPAALLEIIQILCEKLRSASAIIEDNTLEMRARTARGLLRLARQHGRTSKSGVRLQLTMSQTELGSYLSISRENVSRQLARLRDANVITVNDQQIIISDAEGLGEIAAAPSKD